MHDYVHTHFQGTYVCNVYSLLQKSMLKEDMDYIQGVSDLSEYEEEIEELVKSNPSSSLLQAFKLLMERTTQQVCSLVSVTCETYSRLGIGLIDV